MSRQILQDIIGNFQAENFTRFFRVKNDKFQHPNQTLLYEDANFSEGKKLEEIVFEDGNLIVCSFRANQALSERSGKKAQYELGKKILKDTQTDAGIFIFYDKFGNFRFSLIYANYLGRRRDWSTFRRFTYFVSPDLTNKTFLQRIGDGDFSSLAKIKEAFSVEKVTKEFYEDIANWYFWAVEHCRFPKDAEAEENGRNVAVIRLVTRMIFIWFMRERGLVPKELFEERNIQAILKNTAPENATYYHAILQNLFFATLSTKKEDRQFRDEKRFNKGWNKDFDNQYVFRFHDLFASPEKIKDYFTNIPFLNGGLFECLDNGRNDVYIDGFTERKKEYQPQVPNFLFFSDEKKADLNTYYGTKGKNYKVQGLFNILSSFNFTIDENSPDDADIALDPELLGRVFENLLASFNPETSTTARKATGSYYTPREIVDYMVTESLKEYFKTHLPDVKNIDEKLEILFSTGRDENPFSKSESKKLVGLIESVRIVDPAVGSGAFPMGALNRMVFILNKIDLGNELWKQAQLKAAEAMPDPQIRRNTIRQIEEFFKDKNADYGRKLYLIQKCIYGVDIQQIAVEIAKLRFFISLLVDEKIDEKKENWGIEPLPNLDFKIMQGNSLISEFLGIDFDNGQVNQEQVGMLFAEKEDNLIKEFERKKIDFQNEPDKDKKANLKNEVENLMIKIFETKVRKQKVDYFRRKEEIEKKYSMLSNKKTREEMIAKEKQKLSKKSDFDLENIEKQLREFTSKKKTRPFFPWKLYFAEVFEKGGFDIVIGNPPWISNDGISEATKQSLLKHFTYSVNSRFDLSCPFIELGRDFISNKNAIISFVLPEHLWVGEYFILLRKTIYKNLKEVTSLKEGYFENVNNPASLMLLTRQQQETIVIGKSKDDLTIIRKKIENNYFLTDTLLDSRENIIYPYKIYFDFNYLKLKKSILSKNNIKLLGETCLVTDGVQTANILNRIMTNRKPQNTDKYFKALRKGSAIPVRYGSIKWDNWWILKPEYANRFKRPGYSYDSPKRKYCFDADNKIVLRQTEPSIVATIDFDRFRFPNSIFQIVPHENYANLALCYILGIINSKFIRTFYSMSAQVEGTTKPQIYINILKSIPVKIVSKPEQKPIIGIVDKILAITKSTDYLQNSDKQTKVREYEKKIDQLVYKLYRLTQEEIKIVEAQKT